MASVGRLDEGNPAWPYLALHMIPYLATRGSLRRCAGSGPRARIDGKGRAFRLEVDFRPPARSRHRQLKACASLSKFRKDKDGNAEKNYWNTTGQDLSETFKLIARELSNLRIVG